MMPSKKKPALTVAIGVGKPKPDELGAPDDPFGGSKAEEADESPEEEGAEETGAKLLSDMTKPLVDAGLSDDDAKSMLAQIFRATAECLEKGYSGGDDAVGGDEMTGGAPPKGGGMYGR